MCSDFLKMCSDFGHEIFVHSELGTAKKVIGPLVYNENKFQYAILC